jgi:hypothetical protein
MFGTPVRTSNASGETYFQVSVNVSPLGVEMEYREEGLTYNKEAQSRFRTLQSLVLSELAKERGLFKNPPTQAALEAITPNWGYVQQPNGILSFSPYAKIEKPSFPESKLPCLVDIQLKGLEISRSTIRSVWKLHYLGQPPSEIDFDWAPPKPAEGELEEVSDVPTAGLAEEGVFALADPALKAREKAEEKARINLAFASAKAARTAAEKLAAEFYDKYDLSDTESAFTEWLSESDSEDDS